MLSKKYMKQKSQNENIYETEKMKLNSINYYIRWQR